MANGFERLRLSTTASAVALLAGVFGGSRSARAAVVATPLHITTAGVRWSSIKNSNTGPATFGQGFGVTSGGILTASGRNDAFDGSLMCRVNGTTFVNPAGTVDLSTVTGGKKITTNLQTIGSLQVGETFYASSSKRVMRGICSVTNPTGAPIAVTLLMGTNLGSDNQTFIQASSSGDTTVDASDHWFVSSDANPTFGDPVVAYGRFGAGAQIVPTLVQTPGTPAPPASNDNLVDQYTFTVPAGGTIGVMQLVSASPDIASATTLAASFNSLSTLQSAGLLADLSGAAINQIQNYAPVAVAVPVVPAPLLSRWGTLGLALLLASGALLQRMRRRYLR